MRVSLALVACLLILASVANGSAAHGADADGFVPLFDGKNLDGWRVVPAERKADWLVRDGILVGQGEGLTSDLVWKADDLADFELKLEYRFRGEGNSGVHLRGMVSDSKSHPVKGYHADFGHVGVGAHVLGAWDFHGVPRGSQLVQRGHRVVIDAQGKKHVTAIPNALTPRDVHKGEWNKLHVVARGYRFSFTINGKTASEVIDNETSKRIDRGVIALQLHGGPPMTVEFRNIRLKRLSPPDS